MARKAQRTDRAAWVLGIGLPVGLLFAVFSLLPEHDLTGRWPLGISTQEVDAYAHWFDRRSTADSSAKCDTYTLSGGPDGPGWRAVLFTAPGYRDSADVRPARTVTGAFQVRFPKGSPFLGQRRILLAPASLRSIRAKYEEVIANELGLLAPALTLVKVAVAGDTSLYVQEEVVDDPYIERQRLGDAVVFDQAFAAERPDHLFPDVDGDEGTARAVRSLEWSGVSGTLPMEDVVDADAAAALLFMVHIADRWDVITDRGTYTYRWGQERIVPTFRFLHDTATEVEHRVIVGHFLSRLARDPAILRRVGSMQEVLVDGIWRLKERFNAVDRAWLPLLAAQRPGARTQAAAQRMAQVLLDRIGSAPTFEVLAAADPAVLPSAFADALDLAAPATDAIDEVAARFGAEHIGDSLVFRRRGRYVIDRDLTLPKGIALVLEKSVRLEIGPGVDITVQGAMIARGTRVNPVFIRPLREGSAYGTVAVNAENGARCSLTGVRMSGGQSGDARGWRKGMLSVHGAAALTVEGCDFQADSGRAVIAVDGGELRIVGTHFTMIACDGVVAANAQGAIVQCVFNGGADGVVQRGGRLRVEQCRFNGPGDRGTDVGAAGQALLVRCAFDGAGVAVALKDQSDVQVSTCTFTGNALVFQVRAGGSGASRLVLHANTLAGNARERDVEAPSTVETREEPDPAWKDVYGARW